ncbi:MAG: hypothetical protein AB1416_09810 [Actinomycetota bacterium]
MRGRRRWVPLVVVLAAVVAAVIVAVAVHEDHTAHPGHGATVRASGTAAAVPRPVPAHGGSLL